MARKAAVAAIAAMVKDCTLEIERIDKDVTPDTPQAAAVKSTIDKASAPRRAPCTRVGVYG